MDRRLLIPAAILLGACQSPGTAPAGDLETRVRIESPAALLPREGDLATVVLGIRNGSERTVVLRDLVPAGSPPSGGTAVMTWQFSQPGLLEYAADRDEWTYDRRRAAVKRRPVFNSGLLFPGESISIRIRLRLLGLPKDLELTYYELARADVAQMVYFEVREDRDVRFRRFIGEELSRRMTPEVREDVPGHRIVVFPYFEQVVPTTRRRMLRLEGPMEPRPFPLSEAVRRAGFPSADEYTCWSGLDGWVIRREKDVRLVTSSTVVRLPLILGMERVFHYLDALGPAKAQIEFLQETKTLFSDRYPLVADRQGRWFAFLTAPEVLNLFRDLHEAGLVVDAELTPEGGGRLRVFRRS